MALGDILAEAALQPVGAVLELPVRGLGYVVLRYCLRRHRVAWDSHAVLIAGILGWIALFIAGYKAWYRTSASSALEPSGPTSAAVAL